MRYTVTMFAALALVGLFFAPPQISAQSKEIRAVQLDLYEVGKKIDDFKTGQDERVGQLEKLLQQMMESNSKLAEQVRLLQEKVTDSAMQQERRVVTPLSEVKKGVDDLWQQFNVTQGSLDGLKTRQESFDKSLREMSGNFSLLREDLSKTTAPPPTTASGSTAAAGDPATLAFAAAEQDKVMGKLQLALTEFQALADAYPASPQAPMAYYEMALMYVANEQPQDAIGALDRLLERFGDTPLRANAQFAKAEQLAVLERNTEAAREFNNFARQYPSDERAAVAKQRATELSSPAPAKPKSNTKGKRGK